MQAPNLLSWHTSITSLNGQVIPADQQAFAALSLIGRYRSWEAVATFNTQYDISSISISPFVDGARMPTRVVVSHSDDGREFLIAQEFDVDPSNGGVQTFTFDSTVRTQYLRFEPFTDTDAINAVFTADACPLRKFT